MSKRNTKPAPTKTGGRGRSAPVKIEKPKPWGGIAVAVVVAAALIGLVAYAAMNQGAGFEDPLEAADASVGEDLLVTPAKDLQSSHVEGPVDYEGVEPPASGDHSGTPLACQVYAEPISAESVLHSLEHGGVWITYQPELPAEQISTLTQTYGGRPNVAISPFPGQTSPISLQAWARQLAVETPDDPRMERFLDAYIQGVQAPERSVGC